MVLTYGNIRLLEVLLHDSGKFFVRDGNKEFSAQLGCDHTEASRYGSPEEMTMTMTMTMTMIYQTNGEVWYSISLLVPQSWVSDDQLGPIPVSQLQAGKIIWGHYYDNMKPHRKLGIQADTE